MGLHRSHYSWRSLVVRSRNSGLTARLLRVLQLHEDCPEENFVDGVPSECALPYERCKQNIKDSLEDRKQGQLSARTTSAAPAACPRSVPTGQHGACSSGSEESEEGDLHGLEQDEEPAYTDGDE